MIYADHAATSPLRPEVLEAMWLYLTAEFGNPSSVHETGHRAAAALADARAEVARALGCRPGELVFTSGGTEGANLAVKGIALASSLSASSLSATPRRHLVTSAVEHEAVLESVDFLVRVLGFEATVLPVDGEGGVAPGHLAAAIRSDTALVSIQHANNEVGTVQPIAELAAVARDAGVPFHTDTVQSAGRLDVRLDALGVDALSVSGHKLGAPKGVGAVAIRARIPVEPLLHGGGQERGRRSGTENVPGAVGLAAALRLRAEPVAAETPDPARDALIDRVLATIPDARLTGARRTRLPGHASFVLPGTSGEAVLLELERSGVIASSGSACAAGRDEPSPVLLAMGLDPDHARTALRLTLAADTDIATAVTIADRLVDAVAAVRGEGVRRL